jgi:hypothetical protein
MADKLAIRSQRGAAPATGGVLQRRCACGNHAAAEECEACKVARQQGRSSSAGPGADSVGAVTGRSGGREFSRVPVSSPRGRSRGELPGDAEPAQVPAAAPAPAADGGQTADSDSQPEPMQSPPAQGPTIAVTNGWANPAGKNDRTTVGIGELSSFVVQDVEGGSWSSADGKGTTVNSVTFRWTASAAGTNKITYTTADGATSTVTMTTVVPAKLTGTKLSDLSFSAGTQGAGMTLDIIVNPTNVSFQALELMEDTCDASAITGYFTSHAPGPHDAAAGAGTWNQVGPNNDVSDTADSSGWPAPWSKGSFTWAIPASWRLKAATTSTAFSANNNQVVSIAGSDGTTTVTKLGAKTTPRKP